MVDSKLFHSLRNLPDHNRNLIIEYQIMIKCYICTHKGRYISWQNSKSFRNPYKIHSKLSACESSLFILFPLVKERNVSQNLSFIIYIVPDIIDANWPNPPIPWRISTISHNAPSCNRNVQSLPKTLWDLWGESLSHKHKSMCERTTCFCAIHLIMWQSKCSAWLFGIQVHNVAGMENNYITI